MEPIVRIIGWVVFVAAALWPGVALVAFCAAQGGGPADGWMLTARQWGLLWRSVWLSGAAVGACLVVALTVGLCLAKGCRRSGWLAAAAAGVLLAPPMVYAFGWAELLPRRLPNEARCVMVWTLWGWPIAAFVMGAGWSRVGRRAFESALLSVGPIRAFWHVGLPALRRHVVLSGILLFVLFFGDYGVPHACGLIVHATELLLYASSSPRIMDTLWPALPGMVCIGGLLWVAHRLLRAFDDGAVGAGGRDDARWARPIAWLLVIVSALPMVALAVRFGSWDALGETLRTYGSDVAWTIAAAVLAAVLAVVMGVALAAGRRGFMAATALTLVFGACPGAVVGVALAAAYNHAATGWVYDHVLILVFGFVARFGWIGMLAGMLMGRGGVKGIVEQAMTDGASRGEAFLRAAVGVHWPMLAASTTAIAALAVAELPASTVVRPPTFTPLAHVVIEKFHRFEYGMLIALCAVLVVIVIPAVAATMMVRNRRMA